MKTTREVAHILGYANDSVVRLMIKQGRLQADKFGHVWMIHDSEVERLRKMRIKKNK